MERYSVKSSFINSIGYDEYSRTLEVEILHEGVYQYFHVPSYKFFGVMTADSHGEYFDYCIKDCYGCRKVISYYKPPSPRKKTRRRRKRKR